MDNPWWIDVLPITNQSKVLETDVMLQGHDTCKYVFTDITFGVPGDTRVLYSVFDVM